MSGRPENTGEVQPPTASTWTLWSRAAFAVGAAGLIGAMLTDAIAVAGRHLHLPLLGSVELVQAFVVIAASAAMVSATMAREHAVVRVLVDRTGGGLRAALSRFADLACAVFFGVLAAGSAWIIWDLRDGAEQTELLAIPLQVLRLLWLCCAVICCALCLKHAFSKSRERR